jgi:hypothetical protein
MKRFSPWLTALLQSVMLLAAIAYASPWLIAAECSLPSPRRSEDITLRGFQARPVFNGSVVPGGVYSGDELRAAIGRDAVVAAHYRDVRLDEMQAVTLLEGRAAYVSYRRGDKTYWTRERVWLKAGETVLTDGTTTIRARCGNCVSEVKHEGESAVEPAHGELDDFAIPPTPDAGVDSQAADAEAGLGDLLQVPFAAHSLAMLGAGAGLMTPELFTEAPGTGVPPLELPPIMVPAGGTGSISGTVPPLVSGSTPPPVPPPGFVPPDVVPPVMVPPLVVPPLVVPPGWVPPGTDAGTGPGTETGGTATSGVTTGTDTTADGGTSVPEPGSVWLVAAGVIALASRRLRGKV